MNRKFQSCLWNQKRKNCEKRCGWSSVNGIHFNKIKILKLLPSCKSVHLLQRSYLKFFLLFTYFRWWGLTVSGCLTGTGSRSRWYSWLHTMASVCWSEYTSLILSQLRYLTSSPIEGKLCHYSLAFYICPFIYIVIIYSYIFMW